MTERQPPAAEPATRTVDASCCTLETGPHCAITSASAPATGAPGHPHPHTHARGHGHEHHRAAGEQGLRWVLMLTATFMVAEFVGGLVSNSLALLADAAHMLTDVGAIGLSLFALWFARRPPTAGKTFGWARIEILAALVNAATLLLLAAFIFIEAWQRFSEPFAIRGGLMLIVAAGGLVVNVIAAFLLHRFAGESLNVRGAYLHVLGDLLGSVGAIVAALVILTTGWTPADPLISVFVGVLILVSGWNLLRESVDILLESVPAHVDMIEVQRAIDEIPGVDNVHDLHVWTVTSGFLAMSGHAVVASPEDHTRVLSEIHRRMAQRFGIRHVTVQLEH
ncbi:MAG TPA: cation diffusion facilitator family transporter [Longimicrobiales bacterium]|nr:cation diffusion facilitator family transporter [Longimicrobiales bacterium]